MDSGTTDIEALTITDVTKATALPPSPPQLKPGSASWPSQWLTFKTTPVFTASANSAPAMLFATSFFETDRYRANNSVTLDDMERYVLEATMPRSTAMDDDTLSTSSPLRQEPMPRSTISPMPETPMPFSMDNNDDGGGEYEDMFLDNPDFVVIPSNYEPASPPDSPFVLFPPL